MRNKYNNWPTEKIKKELEKLYAVLRKRQEIQEVQEANQRCINHITTKDFVVYWGNYGEFDRKDQPEYSFSFCIKHDGKIYDIYYECSPDNESLYPWWPIVGEDGEDNWDRNGAHDFIPPGFNEACENSYKYRGTFEQAIAQLKRYGFTDIQQDPTDRNEPRTGHPQ